METEIHPQISQISTDEFSRIRADSEVTAQAQDESLL
jgi:hypothetical protein